MSATAEEPLRCRVYRTRFSNSTRWDSFVGRDDDVFVCTPPKSGTTWTQTICALLLHGWDGFDQKPSDLSPWFDSTFVPVEETNAHLQSQTFRRFIKTHTPLDGIPFNPRCTYIAVYRDPRDVFFSMGNHQKNMGIETSDSDASVSERFRAWLDQPAIDGEDFRFSLESIIHHFRTYRRFESLPNLYLLHYADMKRDPAGAVRQIADILGIDIDENGIASVVSQSNFDNMRKNANQFAPYASLGMWKDNEQFFSRGANAQWRGELTTDDLDAYEKRLHELLEPRDALWIGEGAGTGAA